MSYLDDIKENEKLLRVRKWVSEHKVEIAIGIALTITAAYGIKCFVESNGKAISAIEAANISKADILPEVTAPMMPDTISTAHTDLQFNRSGYVRTLPFNQQASKAKLIEAAEKGLELRPGETLVKECLVTRKRD